MENTATGNVNPHAFQSFSDRIVSKERGLTEGSESNLALQAATIPRPSSLPVSVWPGAKGDRQFSRRFSDIWAAIPGSYLDFITLELHSGLVVFCMSDPGKNEYFDL